MTYAPDASEYPVDVQHVGVQRLIGVGHSVGRRYTNHVILYGPTQGNAFFGSVTRETNRDGGGSTALGAMPEGSKATAKEPADIPVSEASEVVSWGGIESPASEPERSASDTDPGSDL